MLELSYLSRIVTCMNQLDMEMHAVHDLGLMDAVVLSAIGRSLVSPTSIVHETGISPSNLSRILRGIEGKGLVERTIDDIDKRRVCFALTASGHSILESVTGSGIEIPPELIVACDSIAKWVEKK